MCENLVCGSKRATLASGLKKEVEKTRSRDFDFREMFCAALNGPPPSTKIHAERKIEPPQLHRRFDATAWHNFAILA